jgi:hypothetical protein
MSEINERDMTHEMYDEGGYYYKWINMDKEATAAMSIRQEIIQ